MNAFAFSAVLAAVLLAVVYAQEDCPDDFKQRVIAAKEECRVSRQARQAAGGDDMMAGGPEGEHHEGRKCVFGKLKDDAFVVEISSGCTAEEQKAKRHCVFEALKQRCPDLLPKRGGGARGAAASGP